MSLVVFAVIVVGAAIVFALVGVTAVRNAMRGRVREGHNDVLVPIFLTTGTIYAVLLGFLVIAVWEQYDAAKRNIADEASLLTTMYRQTYGMPADEQRQMREYLKAYTEAVVGDEWQ